MANLALWYRSFGDPRKVLTLESTELGPRPDNALRVKMRYTPINPSDIIPITGAYSHLIVPPMIAGYEGVGQVIDAPSDTAHMLGQRVLPLRGAGTWQRYVHCDPSIAVPVPEDIADTTAARAYINPMAAHHMLRCWPVAGKRIILTGAGSYCAALLAQWALANGAAEVIGIYRSKGRHTWLEALGVQPLADTDLAGVHLSARNADITFDAVGGPLGSTLLGAMRPNTEFVGYGLLSGQPIQPPAETTATHRRFHLRDILNAQSTAAWQKDFAHLWPLLKASTMPDVEVFSIDCWRDALNAFDTPGRLRKPLLALEKPTT